MENILQNIALIQQRIANACERVGRKPEEVKLLLATKTVTPERIKVA
jgi:alanine racemase domain protein